ncbi:MAG: hypothetical protein MJ054_01235 [Clostridia bacterium]|nr:hypothetical protein [Clostridia bacterium]
MGFIRKNWSRLSLAFLFFIGAVITVFAWVTNSSDLTNIKWLNDFYNAALLISTIVFFFGMVGVTVVKSLQDSKKVVSTLYMCIGSIVTILLIVLIIVASINESSLVLIYGDNAIVTLYQLWVPFLVFGLYPLIKGVTRFIEAETVPAQATVKPTVAPVTETVVAEKAPKAPAKKTTSKKVAAK